MTVLTRIMSQLEELWDHCDNVFAKIPTSKWRDKFGQHWEFMDVPRHFAYVDRTIVADGIMFGSSMPPEKKLFMHTHREFNEWNRQMMEEYRHIGSLEYILERMKESRQAIRRTVTSLNDDDLDQPVWFPITGFAGWRTVQYVLGFCRQHTWAHFTQLCLRLNLAPWKMSAHIIHDSVDTIIRSLPPLLDNTAAQKTNIATGVVITGPGGGYWTIKVLNGSCSITESDVVPSRANLLLTLTPETLIEILSDMRHPLRAMLSGHLRIRGLRYLPTFLKLFHRPNPDKQLSPSQ